MKPINIQPSILNRQASIYNNHLSIPGPDRRVPVCLGGVSTRAGFNIQSKAGFTLLELLVVIVIIMFLAGITIQIVSSIQTNAKKGVTSAQISQQELALKQFESDFGVFPPDSYTTSPISIGGVSIPVDSDLDTGSKCLVFFLGSKFTFNTTSFNDIYGPYIEFKRAQLDEVTGADFVDNQPDIKIEGINGTTKVYQYKDPFGSYYSYDSSSPSNNTASFDIYSFGPDKTPSTSDDITNW
ncbi:MAG: type II secretion system protein GspG [Candidatus Scalindua sp.]